VSELVLTNAKIWAGAYDLSGQSNTLAVEYGAELKDATAFGDAARNNLAGLRTAGVGVDGNWDATLDAGLFGYLGLADVPVSFAATAAEGDRAFTLLAAAGEYRTGERVGEILPFGLRAGSRGLPILRGQILRSATVTGSGNGTGFQLGQVSATQRIYGALHVTAASGATPTLDVKIQSDTSGFPSPLDRITFAQKTAIGYEWASAAGPITDDWWRVVVTVGGGSPSFTFAVVAAIF
jgi:hypothetical protein